jgi:hypothetical protein
MDHRFPPPRQKGKNQRGLLQPPSGQADSPAPRPGAGHRRRGCGGNNARPGTTSSISPPSTSGATGTSTSAARSHDEVVRLFDYDRRRPLAVTTLGSHTGRVPAEQLDGVTVHSITYASPKGSEVPALVVVPKGKGPFPAVIVQHGLPDTKEGMLPAGIDRPHRGPGHPERRPIQYPSRAV